MERFRRTKGVINSRLTHFYDKLKHIYGLYERFVIMYTPFISSICYCINIHLYEDQLNYGIVFAYNSNFSGHSILWLQVVLSRSKNMCKWYKGSIILSMVTHVLNLMCYHGYLEFAKHVSYSFYICIASILCWLIFRVTYKTTKVVHSACTRLEELEKSQSHTSS